MEIVRFNEKDNIKLFYNTKVYNIRLRDKLEYLSDEDFVFDRDAYIQGWIKGIKNFYKHIEGDL